MSETPEDTQAWLESVRLVTGRSANGWHDLNQEDYEAGDAAVENLAFAIASLRQRQEELEDELRRWKEAAAQGEQVENRTNRMYHEARAQLQQAEQERDRARRVFIEEIEQLESQLQQAETALRPFADAIDNAGVLAERDDDYDIEGFLSLTVGDLRRARAALAAPPPNTKEGETA